MMKVAQRLCQCSPFSNVSFSQDSRSGLWVCGECRLPRWAYYLAVRSAQPPGVPIKYAKGTDEESTTSQRASAQPR